MAAEDGTEARSQACFAEIVKQLFQQRDARRRNDIDAADVVIEDVTEEEEKKHEADVLMDIATDPDVRAAADRRQVCALLEHVQRCQCNRRASERHVVDLQRFLMQYALSTAKVVDDKLYPLSDLVAGALCRAWPRVCQTSTSDFKRYEIGELHDVETHVFKPNLSAAYLAMAQKEAKEDTGRDIEEEEKLAELLQQQVHPCIDVARAMLLPCNFWRFTAKDEHMAAYARAARSYLANESDRTLVGTALSPLVYGFQFRGLLRNCVRPDEKQFWEVPGIAELKERMQAYWTKNLSRLPESGAADMARELIATSYCPYGALLTDHRFRVPRPSFVPSAGSVAQRQMTKKQTRIINQQRDLRLSKPSHLQFIAEHTMESYYITLTEELWATKLSLTTSLRFRYLRLWTELVLEETELLLEDLTFLHLPARPIMLWVGMGRWLLIWRDPGVPSQRSCLCLRSFLDAYCAFIAVVLTYFDGMLETREQVHPLLEPDQL